MSHHQIRWLFTLIITNFPLQQSQIESASNKISSQQQQQQRDWKSVNMAWSNRESIQFQVHQQSDNKSWSRSIKNETQFLVSAQLTITLQYTVQQCAVSVGDTAVRLIIRFRWQINRYRIALTMLTMLTVLEVDKPRFLSLVWHSNEDKQLNIYLSYESKEKFNSCSNVNM